MSNRTLIELNHDYCPSALNKDAVHKFGEEIKRLREALEEIDGRHIPDQPMDWAHSDDIWYRMQYGELRKIARQALSEDQT